MTEREENQRFVQQWTQELLRNAENPDMPVKEAIGRCSQIPLGGSVQLGKGEAYHPSRAGGSAESAASHLLHGQAAILFCEKMRKYVAWLKIMGGEISQFMCVMESDHLEGPYTYVHRICKPLQMDTADFALHKDATTGKTYIIFDRPHFGTASA